MNDKRLTEHNETGKWSLKGMDWNQFKPNQMLTKENWEKIYGALCKLKDYEDTGLSPKDVERVNDFEKTQTSILLKRLNAEQKKHEWIPAKYEVPADDSYVLLSFHNFTGLLIGRYEQHDDGSGNWYIGDCCEEDTCLANDLFVSAWMPLPDPYVEADDEREWEVD